MCFYTLRRRISFIIGVLLVLTPFSAWGTSFAIISDTHVGAGDSLYSNLAQRIEKEKIQFIIHTGDAINKPGNSGEWMRFLSITGTGRMLHLAPGNHDIRGKKSLEVYLRFFLKPYLSFGDGNVLFLLLNTELPGEEDMIAGEQLEWLRHELEKPYRFKFVFLHKPLYPYVPFRGLGRHEESRDALHRLFIQRNVSLVVSGHDHIYDYAKRDGIPYVLAPPVRAKQRFPTRNAEPGYITADQRGKGFMFSVKDMEGNPRNEFFVEQRTSLLDGSFKKTAFSPEVPAEFRKREFSAEATPAKLALDRPCAPTYFLLRSLCLPPLCNPRKLENQTPNLRMDAY